MYTRHFQSSNRSNRFSRPGGTSRFGRGRNMKSGNIHEFIRKASVKNYQVSPTPVTEILFSSLNLPESLKATIARHGYTTLTPIQAQGIPAIRAGKDVIGIANTGTGKTAAFLIPLVENILKDFNYKALIISPTRELALQTRDELRKFSGNMPIFSTLCIGQSSMQIQISQLRHDPHVVVGTPGRIKDLINRRILRLEGFKMIILDETDQMLDMGFIHDIKEIISHLPTNRQSLFF
ncbi:DEAD/DEAH box helicase [Candidatus Roizmanbacteria bacterium]|nr:DEAD/DEAH box helicase [Candidatus Roizmanbacteria bacterium]